MVYNRASGGTHMLDAFSAAALQLLAEQPCAISTLTHQLAAQSGAEQPAVRTRLDEVLNTLHTLGLADPIPPCDLVS